MINFIETDMTTSIEAELMILDTPTELLFENIRSQMDRSYGAVNYLNTVSDKLRIIEEEFSDDSETVAKVNDMRNTVFGGVADIIQERLNITLNIDYDNPYDVEEKVVDLYEFFIVNIRKVAYRFIYNFINENKKQLIEDMNLGKPNKDVVTNTARTQKKMKMIDVKILSNLHEVVAHIISLEIPDDEFLEYTRNHVILDMYNSGYISGAVSMETIEFMKSKQIISDIIPEIFIKLTGTN